MTEIERKALAMVNEVCNGRFTHENMTCDAYSPFYRALILAIEQHEAFRQEVSDVVSELSSEYESMGSYYADKLRRFIIAKPDPLVEAIKDADDMVRVPDAPSYPEAIRAALAKRGLEVREIEA